LRFIFSISTLVFLFLFCLPLSLVAYWCVFVRVLLRFRLGPFLFSSSQTPSFGVLKPPALMSLRPLSFFSFLFWRGEGSGRTFLFFGLPLPCMGLRFCGGCGPSSFPQYFVVQCCFLVFLPHLFPKIFLWTVCLSEFVPIFLAVAVSRPVAPNDSIPQKPLVSPVLLSFLLSSSVVWRVRSVNPALRWASNSPSLFFCWPF